jgi:hypothetical protein
LITLNVHQQESCCKTNYFALPLDESLRGFVLPGFESGFIDSVPKRDSAASRPYPGNLMCGIAATIVGFVTSEVTW